MKACDPADALMNEFNDQNEWMRHLEDQRANLTNILLVVSAALIAFLGQRGPQPDLRPLAAALVAIAILGILAIENYLERFEFHMRRQEALRRSLDRLYGGSDPASAKRSPEKGLIESVLAEGDEKHEDDWSRGWRAAFGSERRVRQHQFWLLSFALIGGAGIYFLFLWG